MRNLLAILFLLAVTCGAAILTKPSSEDFDETLRTLLMERVMASDLGSNESGMETLFLAGCKLSPSECFETIRALMDVRFEDQVLYTRADVRGIDEFSCYGAFKTFWC